MNRFESGSSAVGAMALPALLQPLPFNKREMWPLLPVVVAQLVDQSLPTRDTRFESNHQQFLFTINCTIIVLKRPNKDKRGREWPTFSCGLF